MNSLATTDVLMSDQGKTYIQCLMKVLGHHIIPPQDTSSSGVLMISIDDNDDG